MIIQSTNLKSHALVSYGPSGSVDLIYEQQIPFTFQTHTLTHTQTHTNERTHTRTHACTSTLIHPNTHALTYWRRSNRFCVSTEQKSNRSEYFYKHFLTFSWQSKKKLVGDRRMVELCAFVLSSRNFNERNINIDLAR